eukprot:scaffold6091_cov164-Amphora_coffeaeformis.AAC.18
MEFDGKQVVIDPLFDVALGIAADDGAQPDSWNIRDGMFNLHFCSIGRLRRVRRLLFVLYAVETENAAFSVPFRCAICSESSTLKSNMTKTSATTTLARPAATGVTMAQRHSSSSSSVPPRIMNSLRSALLSTAGISRKKLVAMVIAALTMKAIWWTPKGQLEASLPSAQVGWNNPMETFPECLVNTTAAMTDADKEDKTLFAAELQQSPWNDVGWNNTEAISCGARKCFFPSRSDPQHYGYLVALKKQMHSDLTKVQKVQRTLQEDFDCRVLTADEPLLLGGVSRRLFCLLASRVHQPTDDKHDIFNPRRRERVVVQRVRRAPEPHVLWGTNVEKTTHFLRRLPDFLHIANSTTAFNRTFQTEIRHLRRVMDKLPEIVYDLQVLVDTRGRFHHVDLDRVVVAKRIDWNVTLWMERFEISLEQINRQLRVSLSTQTADSSFLSQPNHPHRPETGISSRASQFYAWMLRHEFWTTEEEKKYYINASKDA